MSKWDGLTNAHRYWSDLSAVTVVPEASKLWNLSKWKLLRMLNEGKIAGVKAETSGTWLISVACMIDLFGEPLLTPEDPLVLVDINPELN